MDNRENRVFNSLLGEYERVTATIENLDKAFFEKSNVYFIGIFACVAMVFSQTNIIEYSAIIFVFILLYYTYNTIKYTIRICELRGQAMALEKRLNYMLDEIVYCENLLSLSIKPIWYNKFFYGVILQTVFIIPVICFCAYIFLKAIIVLAFSKWAIVIIVCFTCIAGLTLLGMIILCCFVARRWRKETELFWEEKIYDFNSKCERGNSIDNYRGISYIDIKDNTDKIYLKEQVHKKVHNKSHEWCNLKEVQNELLETIRIIEGEKETTLAIHYPAIVFYVGIILGAVLGVATSLLLKLITLRSCLVAIAVMISIVLGTTFWLVSHTKKLKKTKDDSIAFYTVILSSVNDIINKEDKKELVNVITESINSSMNMKKSNSFIIKLVDRMYNKIFNDKLNNL